MSLPSRWFLHFQLGLSLTSLHRDVLVPLTLLPPPPTVVTSPASLTGDGGSVSAIISITTGMLTAAIFMLVLCLGVVTLAACCLYQGKAKFNSKTAMLRAAQRSENLNSSWEKQRRVKVMRESVSQLKRTNSTTGFPTLENRARQKRVTTTSAASRRDRDIPSPPGLQRTQSLPSIFSPHAIGMSLPPNEPAVLTRRINLNRVHTKVKMVNVERSGLNSWTKEQLNGIKALDNLRIVQDLAIRHKHYGVNEILPGTAKSGPLAKYTVRSLAASAKTPEPGAKPITAL